MLFTELDPVGDAGTSPSTYRTLESRVLNFQQELTPGMWENPTGLDPRKYELSLLSSQPETTEDQRVAAGNRQTMDSRKRQFITTFSENPVKGLGKLKELI